VEGGSSAIEKKGEAGMFDGLKILGTESKQEFQKSQRRRCSSVGESGCQTEKR